MTVSSETNRKDYAGNGSTTEFATGFRFLENDQLKVILTVDSTGVETVKILNTDYSVTGADDDAGGTVTMIVAPSLGETLTIKRDMEIVQETEYVEGDNFPAKSHERALDKLTMLVQQAQEEINRSLKLSEGQQSSGLSIPEPIESQFLQWDADGNLKNTNISTLGAIAVSVFGQGLIAALDSDEAREYLEITEVVEWDVSKEYPLNGQLVLYSGDLWKRLPAWVLGDEPGVDATWESYDERINNSGRDVATSAEIRTGANNAKVVTPFGLNETILGLGQTWQDVSASRSTGVTYTNTTGRPLFVMLSSVDGGTNVVQIDIDSVTTDIGSQSFVAAFFVVPDGSTYSATLTLGAASFRSWNELR